MSERELPRTIGRYRIEGVLGEGAMSVVYAGFDPDIERQVAIKCLRREAETDPSQRRRFAAEARAAGHLVHPHILTIFDAGESAQGQAYIAMERLSGETLASRVAREGLPPVTVILDLAEKVSAALDHAHAKGVVHHDIKPENIMLGDGWSQVKVSDFGIAERSDEAAADRPRTEIGGTLAYMAPEQLRGEPTDARSDLFSLGVVLYWLVTGKLPWRETEDVQKLIRERRRLRRPGIVPRDPATPTILVDIVRTLLAPASEARYQSGAEIVEQLRLARREYDRLFAKPLGGRIVSLRVRWSGILGGVLSLTLLLGLAAIYAKQNVAVTGLALDFGHSLGHLIASEAAEDLLLGDRAATRALVEDLAHNRQISYLAIADRQGAVVASTRPDQVGRPMPVLAGRQPPGRSGDIQGERSRIAGGASQGGMLLFDMPIHYQAATVGELRLGIGDAPLRAAQRTTLGVIIAVLLATLLAVVGAAYWLSRRLLSRLDLLAGAMMHVARGDFGHRIRLARRDELGHVFATFNLMNGALQAGHDHRRHAEAGKPATGIEHPTVIIPLADPDGGPTRGRD
ncbi:MAG: protein kinase [Xanthomonadaceae bacterium]|nr:protein kinase [Xanthomonadaceae bacterium]MDE2248746.1 protein kinase [Xanthomonadaceae bacterium]